MKARRGRSLPRSGFTRHASDTPVAPLAARCAFAPARSIEERQDRLAAVPRERPAAPAIRGAFSWEVASPSCRPLPVAGRRAAGLVFCRPVALPPTRRRSSLLRAHATSANRLWRCCGFACALDPVCGSRCSVRKGSTRRFSESGDACRFLQRIRCASTPETSVRTSTKKETAASFVLAGRLPTRRESGAVATRASPGTGRECVRKGRARGTVPFSSAFLEHPSHRHVATAEVGDSRAVTRRPRPTASASPRRATD